MPPIYRIFEIAVYSLLNFLPFLFLALYPFRRSLRFSGKATGLLIAVLTVIQLLLGAWAAFFANGNAARISAVSTLLYAAFYFLAVKKHFGKTFFTLLMISNIANFAVIAAKCAEGLIFPTLAVQSYRWSFSLMLFAVEAVLSVPIFLYMKRVYTPAAEKEPSGFEWRYLWLIPATFYVMWYYAFYGNISRTSLEIAMRPKNTLFLFFINVGAVLIYYVVAQLISEQNKTLRLKELNYGLKMQAMQYENLRERILEAGRAKHDMRHHIAVMQEYLNSGRLDELNEYLKQYGASLPDDSLVRFCENTAANAVLLYFAQQAKDNGIDYIVKARIPSEAAVSDTDISVLFGNLLENALDACKAEITENKKIIIRAEDDGGSLCITADNAYSGALKYADDGNIISSKHSGTGIGTQSVKSIAESCGGVCRFEARDGMFYASVLCPGKQRKTDYNKNKNSAFEL